MRLFILIALLAGCSEYELLPDNDGIPTPGDESADASSDPEGTTGAEDGTTDDAYDDPVDETILPVQGKLVPWGSPDPVHGGFDPGGDDGDDTVDDGSSDPVGSGFPFELIPWEAPFAHGDDPGDDSTTDDGTTDDGTTDDGTTDDGTTDDGTTDDGTTDDGTTDDGTTDDGTTDDGTTDDGTTDDGTTDDGTMDDGATDDGATDDGTTDDGTSDDGTTDSDPSDDDFEEPSEQGCRTQGYWKNHPESWELEMIWLGDVEYTAEEAMDLLWLEVEGDASVNLAHQLIAAKLNVAWGWTSPDIEFVIDGADEWLVQNADADGLLPYAVDPNTLEGQDAVLLAQELDFFNNDQVACDDFTSTVNIRMRADGTLKVSQPFGTLGCATAPSPVPWSVLFLLPLVVLNRRR